MIRWSYLLPRLAVLLVALAVVHFGVPPLVRWGLVRTLETATGNHIEVGTVWTSPARAELRISGLEMARSPSSKTNAFQFDSAKFSLDINAFAHRRYVIDQAQIRGLRFDTPRSDSETDEQRREVVLPDASEVAKIGQQHAQQWIQQAAAVLENRLIDEFESIRLARQLRARWPEEYGQLRQQANELRQAAQKLHQAFASISSPSLSMDQLNQLQQRWQEVLQLRADVEALHQRTAQLARQLQRDRTAIEVAWQQDYKNVSEKLRMTQLSGEQLNDFLLDDEVRQWWVQLKPWLDFTRWLTDAPDVNALGDRGRVVDYEPAGTQPSFLLRAADLDGQLVLAGQQIDFVGQARNLVLPSQLGGGQPDRPARLRLVTRGPFTARVFTRLDRVAGQPRHDFALQCDDLPLPARSWGNDDSLRVTLAPSTVQIQARLVATQQRLDGRVQITQQHVQMAFAARQASVCTQLLAPLSKTAETIEQFDLAVEITGTLDDPQWRLTSNFGPQITQQLQTAAQQLAREQAAKVAAEADQRLQQEFAELEQRLTVETSDIDGQLQAAAQLLSGLAEPVASRFKPLNNLLQRF